MNDFALVVEGKSFAFALRRVTTSDIPILGLNKWKDSLGHESSVCVDSNGLRFVTHCR